MKKKYDEFQIKLKAFRYALFVMGFDASTDCPENGKSFSYEQQMYFRKEVIELKTSEEYFNVIKSLNENNDELNENEKKSIAKEYKELVKARKIPKELLFENMKDSNKARELWHAARHTHDYTEFEKVFEKMVDFKFKYAELVDNTKNTYDFYLDEHEEGTTQETYDKFFGLIKTDLVPFIKEHLNRGLLYNTDLDSEVFEVNGQKELTNYIMNQMDYTTKVGCVRETVHPFSSGMNSNDCRITTFYDENLFISNLYSVMHEVGHALYNLQHDESLNNTNLFGGCSSGMHESQSRLYENCLGRNQNFINANYEKFKSIFPKQFSKYTSNDLYQYVNASKAQFIRIEADELTYPIHVMIRYEVEKALMNKEITVYEVSKKFDDLMEEYLGIRPANKTEGCFQDVHWSYCSMGYFPTYALGSAYSAQFYNQMNKEMNVNELLSNNDFKTINKWLKEKIHQFADTKTNNEILLSATNEEFNPKYYIDYLIEKFKSL
ncbi:MAG: carboxypeptidase M32 [bacterium]